MHGMEYITEETVNKLQETIKNKPYICNDSLENEVKRAELKTMFYRREICNHKWVYKHLNFRICEKCGKVESCY